MTEKRKSNEEKLQEYIDEIVAKAPPLTQEQKDRRQRDKAEKSLHRVRRAWLWDAEDVRAWARERQERSKG